MKKAKKAALTGILAALALALGYLEFLIPVGIPGVPGVKPGFANIMIMAALYLLGAGEAAVISAARILLSWLLFGSFTSLVYSLCGGALSLAVMLALKKSKAFGFVGVSVGGAVAHNTAQITAASLMLGSGYAFYYLPVLLTAAAVTGTVNGLLLKAALPAAERIVKSNAK